MYKFSKRRQKVWLTQHQKLYREALLHPTDVSIWTKYDKYHNWLKKNHPRLYKRLVAYDFNHLRNDDGLFWDYKLSFRRK